MSEPKQMKALSFFDVMEDVVRQVQEDMDMMAAMTDEEREQFLADRARQEQEAMELFAAAGGSIVINPLTGKVKHVDEK